MASSSGCNGDGSLKTTFVKTAKNLNYEMKINKLTPSQIKKMRPPLTTISDVSSSSSGSNSIFDLEDNSSRKPVSEECSLIKKLTNKWTTQNVTKNRAVDSKSDSDPPCVFLYSTQEDADQNKLSIKVQGEGTFILPKKPENNQSLIQFLSRGEVNGCDSNIGKFTMNNNEKVMIFGSKLAKVDNLRDIVFGNAQPHLEPALLNADKFLSGDSTAKNIKLDTKNMIKTVFGHEIKYSSPSGQLKDNPAERVPILKLYIFALEKEKIDKITELIEFKYKDMLIEGENGQRLLPLGGKNVNARVLVTQMIRDVSHNQRSKLVKRLKDQMEIEELEQMGYYPTDRRQQRTEKRKKGTAKSKMSIISPEDSCDSVESPQLMENVNFFSKLDEHSTFDNTFSDTFKSVPRFKSRHEKSDSFNSQKSSLRPCTPSMDSIIPSDISAVAMSPLNSTPLEFPQSPCFSTPTDFSAAVASTPWSQWDKKLGMMGKGSSWDGEEGSGDSSRGRTELFGTRERSEEMNSKEARKRLVSIKINNPEKSSFVHAEKVNHFGVIKRLGNYNGVIHNACSSVDIKSRLEVVLSLDADNFSKNIMSNDTVLVSFFAPWWRWSENMEPELTRAAQELGKSNITLAKVDVTVEKNLAKEYNIFKVPTSLVFKRGVRVAEYCGNLTSTDLINFIRKIRSPSKKSHSNMKQVEDISKVQQKENDLTYGYSHGTPISPMNQLEEISKVQQRENNLTYGYNHGTPISPINQLEDISKVQQRGNDLTYGYSRRTPISPTFPTEQLLSDQMQTVEGKIQLVSSTKAIVKGEEEEGVAARELVRIMKNETEYQTCSTENYPDSSNSTTVNEEKNYILVSNSYNNLEDASIIETWNNADANMTDFAPFVYQVESTIEIVDDVDTLNVPYEVNSDPNNFSDLIIFPNMSTS